MVNGFGEMNWTKGEGAEVMMKGGQRIWLHKLKWDMTKAGKADAWCLSCCCCYQVVRSGLYLSGGLGGVAWHVKSGTFQRELVLFKAYLMDIRLYFAILNKFIQDCSLLYTVRQEK